MVGKILVEGFRMKNLEVTVDGETLTVNWIKMPLSFSCYRKVSYRLKYRYFVTSQRIRLYGFVPVAQVVYRGWRKNLGITFHASVVNKSEWYKTCRNRIPRKKSRCLEVKLTILSRMKWMSPCYHIQYMVKIKKNAKKCFYFGKDLCIFDGACVSSKFSTHLFAYFVL
jgi:hypothetical protein